MIQGKIQCRNKLNYLLYLLLFFLSLSANAGGGDHFQRESATSSQQLANFDRIQVSGNIHLEIKQAKGAQGNSVLVPPKEKNWVITKIANNTLCLEPDPAVAPMKLPNGELAPGPTVVVTVGNLTHLTINDDSSVYANPLQTPGGLTVVANTTGDITLTGMVNLESLLICKAGHVRIAWVNSQRLWINSMSISDIELAGVANMLTLRLADHAYFNGQYLRADNVYIQTTGYAIAHLHVNNNLRAFATDWSNIYYYNLPASITRFSTGSANILQVDWAS